VRVKGHMKMQFNPSKGSVLQIWWVSLDYECCGVWNSCSTPKPKFEIMRGERVLEPPLLSIIKTKYYNKEGIDDLSSSRRYKMQFLMTRLKMLLEFLDVEAYAR
jgi:hypothetical protein